MNDIKMALNAYRYGVERGLFHGNDDGVNFDDMTDIERYSYKTGYDFGITLFAAVERGEVK